MKHLIKRYIGLIALGVLLFSCGGDDDGGGEGNGGDPPPPVNTPPGLIGTVQFPTANLLCIDNNVAFDWDDATDPEGDAIRYRITIARDRDLTQIEEMRTVGSSEATILLERGVAFYWSVVAIDNQGAEGNPSPTLAFFTMGFGEENSVPFTAALVGPSDQGNVGSGLSLIHI